MEIRAKAKIAKDKKYLTSSDDVRISCDGDGMWSVTGFAHNPDGEDCKQGKMIQNGDHYGRKNGETRGITLIDTPQFFSTKKYTTPEIHRALRENVPLSGRWGLSAAHFGPHFPITFRFCGVENFGECALYDVEMTQFNW